LSHGQLQDIVDKRASLPYRIGEPRWVRTFQPRPGIAERFRDGRCLLAGDSAHCVVPIGGQGLNLGIQDAFNLGWKLAGVIQGRYREEILDSYDLERRNAASQVTAVVDKQVLAAKQVKKWPSLLRDLLITVADRIGLLRRLAAPLISQVGLAYGRSQSRPLVLPQRRRACPGHRVPFYPPSTLDGNRPALDLQRHTVLLWPGHAVSGNWPARRLAITRALGDHAVVRDLATMPATQRKPLRAVFGRRPVLALVRPDGHLAVLARVTEPDAVLRFLAALAPDLPPGAAAAPLPVTSD
jgi:hypothetical protein